MVTRDQFEAQGVQTLRQTTAYSAGVVSNYFDSRVDSFSARGGSVSQYQDGLLRTYGTYNTSRPDPYTLERVEFLRGPSSVLYGQGSVGGVLNLTSKRPQAEALREVQVQVGSYGRKQIATDLTGAVTEDGQWLYRLVAVGRESGTQVDHVNDDRLVIAPSLTWRPSADTSLTLQALYQKDKSGSLIGFFPWQGTRLPSPYGQIPTSTFIGEPGWDSFDTENKSWGYLFSHRLNADWTVRQNLRRTISDVDYRSIYTSFTAIPGQGRPARPVFNPDNRSVYRDASWQVNGGRMLVIDTQLEGKLLWGAAEHTVLAGMDAQRNSTSQSTWRGLTAPFDVYNPVYGNFTPPTASQLVRQPGVSQKQLGFYAQDQIKWGRWTATLGLRHDSAQTDTEGRPASAVDEKAWTKRAGATYQMDGGWAPYLGYSESFQPLGGVDVYGTPYKAPTRRAMGSRREMAAAGPGPVGLCRRLYAAREEPQDHRPRQPAQQPADRRGQGQRFRGRADRQPGPPLGRHARLCVHRRRHLAQQWRRPGSARDQRAAPHGVGLADPPLCQRRARRLEPGCGRALHGFTVDGHQPGGHAFGHPAGCHGFL